MRGARYAAPLIRRMTGVCAGRTAFLREKRRILRFRQTPFSAYGIFLQNPANFPFRFFSYGKRGIRIKKATRRARDVTPARFAPDRPPVGVVRAPPRQAAAIARRAQRVFRRANRILRAAPQTSAPRLKIIRPQKNGRIELQTIYFVSPQAFKNLPNAALPCSSCLNTAVLSRMFSHTFSTYAVTIFSAFSSLFFVPCFASKE